MAENIILIGFMGVGKGRTARALAARTGIFAVDTDDLIESMVKMKVRKIFQVHGEAFFRQLELQTARWLEKQVQQTIVSTGGGFFAVHNIRRLGRVIYLHASLEVIIERIRRHPNGEKKIKKRPLLQDMVAAADLFEQRLPRYRAVADHEISVADKTTSEVVDEILPLLAS